MDPIVKVIGIGALFLSVLLAESIVIFPMLILILLALFRLGQIPIGRVWQLALYPAFFSLIFALVKLFESWQLGVIIIVRSALAAITIILLITTTPYYEIMGIFAKFMPSLLVDVFIFTYRAFFILVDQIGNMLQSIKLRGGYHRRSLAYNIKNMASILGVLILNSLEMSERMYMIYSLRGYGGGTYIDLDRGKVSIFDIIFLCLSILVLIGVIIWRIL